MSRYIMLPCPLCSGKAVYEHTAMDAVIRCVKCRLSLVRRHPSQGSAEFEVVTGWNTRGGQAPIANELHQGLAWRDYLMGNPANA